MAVAHAVAQAQTPETKVPLVIIDATETLRGYIGDQSKLNVLSDLLKTRPSSVPVGRVLAFGQKGSENCISPDTLVDSFEQIQPPWLDRFKRLEPSGKIAVAGMLEQALKTHTPTGSKTAIVLIVGERDICKGDLCAVVRQLHSAKRPIDLSILALNVAQSSQKELQCAARETGGIFINATKVEEAHLAFEHLLTRVTDTAHKVTTVHVTLADTAVAGSEIKIQWDGAANPFDRVVLGAMNDQFDYDSKYLPTELKGEIELKVPAQPGQYKVKTIAGLSGAVLNTKTIRVAMGRAEVKPVSPVTAGAQFFVEWEGPRKTYDQIRVIDPKNPNVHQFYAFARMCPINRTKLVAPERPGAYEVVYLSEGEKVLARTPLNVTKAVASVKVDSSVSARSRLVVQFRGPMNEYDQIQIISSNTPEKPVDFFYTSQHVSQRAEIIAPEVPGHYRVRYVTFDKHVLAEEPLTVTHLDVVLKGPNKPVMAGTKFNVEWQGPDNEYDQIRIKDPAEPTKEWAYTYPKLHKSGTLQLDAPSALGRYRIEYVSRDEKVLAHTLLEVSKATAELTPINSPVKAGMNFEIAWIGPDHRDDQIRITDPNNRSKDLGLVYVRRHGSRRAWLIAPREVGDYEVQYLSDSNSVLASTRLEVR